MTKWQVSLGLALTALAGFASGCSAPSSLLALKDLLQDVLFGVLFD